jgi:hypothetical protein
MSLSRIISLIFATIYVIATIIIYYPSGHLKSVLVVLIIWMGMSLAAIWFGNALGDIVTNQYPGPVGPEVRKTPRGFIPFFGWVFLVLPALWFIVTKIS